MAVPTADSLLKGPRATLVIFQHLVVVIGFDHKHVYILHVLANRLGCKAKVCQPGDAPDRRKQVFAGATSEFVGNRVVGVVGDGKRVDFEIGKFEGGAGVEKLPIRLVFHLWLQCFRGQHIREHLGVELLSECRNACSVVAVFVSYKDRIDLLRVDSAFFELDAQLLATEPRIDEDLAILCDKHRAIAGTATA